MIMMVISFTALMEHTRFPQHKEPPEVRSVFVCLCLRQVCVCWLCKRFWNPAAETVAVVAAASARLKCNKATDDWQSARLPPLLKWNRLLGFLSLTLPLSAYRSCHSEGRRASAAAAVAAVHCTELYRTVLYSVLFHAHLSFSLTPGYPELWKTHSVELCLNANTHYTITSEVWSSGWMFTLNLTTTREGRTHLFSSLREFLY